MEELLHFRIEGCSAQNHFLKLTAKSIGKFIAELFLDFCPQNRNTAIVFGFVHKGLELVLVHLLNHQRNSNDNIRMDFAERLHNDFGRRNTAEEMYMHADGHLEEELEHHAVHVGRGQHGHHVHAGL